MKSQLDNYMQQICIHYMYIVYREALLTGAPFGEAALCGE